MNPWTSINRNARISLVVVGVLGLFILFGLPGLNPDWFQFTRNYEIGDNSGNWANHEYGYNLMMSAEPNSIFMTEGGDNQVFSLLYFATVERRRPDIDFFDQKGNVFPRLYGDLLNTHPQEVELIRNIRDFQLFSTGRPIYLTWERPNLEKLNINTFRQQKKEIISKVPQNQQAYLNNKYRLDTLDQLKATARGMVSKSVYDLELRSGGNLADQDFRYLGPWYLKNFGMVFRVTPLRYAIVDALETLNGVGDFSAINPEVGAISKLVMIPAQFNYYITQLESEGYVRQVGDKVELIKPFRGKFDHIDPITLWDHYRFSNLQVSNAHYWDFLTREIFGNTIRTMTLSVNRYVNRLVKQLAHVSDPDQRNLIVGKINHWNQKLEEVRKTASLYNYDNPGMTYPYALEMQRRNDLPEAIKLFLMSARANHHYHSSFLRAAELTLTLAERDREKQQQYLNQARSYLREFYQAQEINQAMTGNPPQNNNLNIVRSLEQRIQGIENTPVEQVEKLEQEAGEDIDKLNELARVYRERGNHNQALEVMEKIQKLEPLEFSHYLSLIDYAKENRLDIALRYVNEAISKYDQLQGEKPPAWELEYYKGGIYFNYALVVQSQDPNNKQQFRVFLDQANLAMKAFMEQFQLVKDNADNPLLQKGNNAEKMMQKINAMQNQYSQ